MNINHKVKNGFPLIRIYLYFFSLFPLSFFCSRLCAQDTLVSVAIKKVKLDPAFDYDQRFSFISKKPVNIWGTRVGVFVNDKFKVGVGGYFLDDHLKNQTLALYPTELVNVHRKLYFGTCYFEPFLFRSKFWELSVPCEAGFGKSFFQYYSSTSDLFLNAARKNFIPVGAGLSLSFKCPPIRNFKPTRWIGLNAMLGYRYCVLEDVFEGEYNGIFWSVSGTIFIDRLTDDCREWKKERKDRKQHAADLNE